MRTFNLNNIEPFTIFRVYKDKNNHDLVLWQCNNHEIRYCNLTEEEENKLIDDLKKLFSKNHMALEVYDGFDEAKSDRRLHDICGRRY